MSINNFMKAMEFTAKWEGLKFTNDPADKGGPTKYGITLATAKANGLDKDADGDVDAADVNLLTPADALAVYRTKFWDLYGCDKQSLPLCVALFDSYVQHNPNRVKEMLLSSAGDWRKFIQARKDFYTRIIVKDPTQKKFQKGWTNRMNDLSKYCEILELET